MHGEFQPELSHRVNRQPSREVFFGARRPWKLELRSLLLDKAQAGTRALRALSDPAFAAEQSLEGL